MANSRKDHKGRKLKEGESWRKDGRYSYRYTDIRSGKRLTVYAKDLPELREKEKQIAKDLEDNILTDGAIKKLTLNKLFERYMSTRELKESTRANYLKTWENRVKDEIGNIKVVQILPSHIKSFYSKLSKAGYAYSTIKFIDNMICPALEMAVDDDIIRKNPAKFSISDYGRQAEERIALTVLQQEKMLEFVKNNQVYNTYYPMLRVMLGTGVRCGDDDDKIRLNQRKPSKYKGLSRFGPEKNLQRINKFMKERPIFYKNLIQMKENFRFYLRCFYCITKVVILQFNSENRTELARNG